MGKATSQEQINSLAIQALTLSRNTLLVKLRYLDMALSQFRFTRYLGTMGTDGRHLYYDPMFVLLSCKEDRETPVRNYFHTVMHCIFRHMFIGPNIDQHYWNLACDIAVESAISDLRLSITTVPRESIQQREITRLAEHVKIMTAERLYRHFIDQESFEDEFIRLQDIFQVDDHDPWYKTPETTGQNDENDDGDQTDGDSDQPDDQQPDADTSELSQIWKKIAEHIQVDQETFSNSRQQGTDAGGLIQNLREINRERIDYSDFLRKFAVRGEVMKIDDDEFDYIFYTYGLRLYKNLPLIEPLEYKDVKRIREFVIAIDTSGSVSGELVQLFLQKTYNILKNTESFFSKFNLHLIQCDADIQEDVKITSQSELDHYLETMRLRGFGGTDFRPVFSYVDDLISKKEFKNLKGLLYFTDGFGNFPTQKPAYETAFVFVEETYYEPPVPPWAIRLVLEKNEILEDEKNSVFRRV